MQTRSYTSAQHTVFFVLSGLAPTHSQPAKNLLCSLGSSPRSSYHFPGSHGIGPREKEHLESRKWIHITFGTKAAFTHHTTGAKFTFKTNTNRRRTWGRGQDLGEGQARSRGVGRTGPEERPCQTPHRQSYIETCTLLGDWQEKQG